MSAAYTDDQLLASTRDYAFNGLLNITGLDDDNLRRQLRDHFSAILKLIDDARRV